MTCGAWTHTQNACKTTSLRSPYGDVEIMGLGTTGLISKVPGLMGWLDPGVLLYYFSAILSWKCTIHVPWQWVKKTTTKLCYCILNILAYYSLFTQNLFFIFIIIIISDGLKKRQYKNHHGFSKHGQKYTNHGEYLSGKLYNMSQWANRISMSLCSLDGLCWPKPEFDPVLWCPKCLYVWIGAQKYTFWKFALDYLWWPWHDFDFPWCPKCYA